MYVSVVYGLRERDMSFEEHYNSDVCIVHRLRECRVDDTM